MTSKWFVEFAGTGSGKVFPGNPASPNCDARSVMGHFDGNTVTALWNYAQHFAMSDNSFNTQFGPSTPGALNLIAGQTHGATYQDGHAADSDPLAEQQFLVETINRLQRLPEWERTAVIIAYDDSDGWFDHAMGPIISQSQTAYDALTGVGQCGTATGGPHGPFEPGRCGYGPRLPLLVTSPFAKVNFVDSTVTDQTSILRFIEDNWQLGRIGNGSFDAIAGTLQQMFDFNRESRAARLFLDTMTGQPIGGDDDRR